MTTDTRDTQFQTIADRLQPGQTIVEPLTGTRCGSVLHVQQNDDGTTSIELVGECGDAIEPFTLPATSPVTIV